MKNQILLIGGGGHCKSCIDVIEQEKKYIIAGIIDKKEKLGTEILGYKIIGCDEDLDYLVKSYRYALVTMGQLKTNSKRVKIFRKLKEIGFNLSVIISPLAYVSKHSSIDEGTIIMHNALVNANVKIGKNCIINSKSLVEHDAIIEDNCHISTGVVVNGGVVVRENTFFGSNATSREYIEVQGFIKSGSVIK